MKILTDLSPIAAKAESRYAIPCSWVEQWGERHVNLATDGRCAAIIPVEQWGEDDVVGPLPIEATKMAAKMPGTMRGTLTANGSVVVGATTFDRKALVEEFRAPQVQQCVPAASVDTVTLSIDVALLHRLAKVLMEARGEKAEAYVTLSFATAVSENGKVMVPVTHSPIVVHHALDVDIRDGSVPFGIIMPLGDQK